MPITDYEFRNRIFFARESGVISSEDAREWAQKLSEHARQSSQPIVALVDALTVGAVNMGAQLTFSKATFTPNVIAVVVATNLATSLTSSNIGLMGKQRQTVVFPTLEQARQHAEKLLFE